MHKSTFVFDSFSIDLPGRILTFHYVVNHGDETFSFAEQLLLPQEVHREIPEQLLRAIVVQLHLILGISYWKLFCSEQIEIRSTTLSKAQAEFWNTVYTKGLGEFFYRNTIDYRGLVQFPSTDTKAVSTSFPQTDRSLVGVGGGKDSIVSIELLKKVQKQITGYSIEKEDVDVIHDTIKIAGINSLHVTRVLDPKLSEFNARNDTYNGHVPISTIYAFVGVLLGILYDYRYVVTSNERSANYGNVEYLGMTINHQWSKSLEFETIFRDYVHQFVTPDITYFSLLRPWYEIKIAETFAQFPQYFKSFSSCNRNFSSTHPNGEGKRWCGECPKCAFVFAALAAFIKKDQLVNIFGENLFTKESLIPLYKELLGIKGFKPFECVGTPEETTVAFYRAYQSGEYNDDSVMKMYVNDCLSQIKNIDQLERSVFESADDSSIPEEFREVIT